jgi:LmbE family N-acetylglucosaminyl deacetylase
VLVVAAHPDDAEFGCAGTVMKWVQAGRLVTYLILTSGDKGSRDPDQHPGRLAARREAEQRSAAADLGVSEVVFLRHPDGLLENTLALRREIAHQLRILRPHILLTIDPWRLYQLHPDHRAAGQAALDAVYAAREWYIFPEQLAGGSEPWRVREAFLFWTDHPDTWEDISCCLEGRIGALLRHASQMGSDPDRVVDRVRRRAAEAGERPGFAAAEAFKHILF